MGSQAAVKPKNMTWQFCIFQGLYWMSCCSLFGYTTVFLMGRGYTGGQIGIITATASVCSAILQPVFAGIAGGSKKISMVNVMTLIGLFNMLMDGVLILCPQNFFITAALFIYAVAGGDGRVRIFFIAASFLGCGIYFLTVGRLVVAGLNKVVDVLAFLWRLLCFPLKWLWNLCKKFLVIIKKFELNSEFPVYVYNKI